MEPSKLRSYLHRSDVLPVCLESRNPEEDKLKELEAVIPWVAREPKDKAELKFSILEDVCFETWYPRFCKWISNRIEDAKECGNIVNPILIARQTIASAFISEATKTGNVEFLKENNFQIMKVENDIIKKYQGKNQFLKMYGPLQGAKHAGGISDIIMDDNQNFFIQIEIISFIAKEYTSPIDHKSFNCRRVSHQFLLSEEQQENLV